MSKFTCRAADDFEACYPDLSRVTVQSIDVVNGIVTASAEDVPAAKLLDKRMTTPARSGSVWVRGNEWWVRVDRLGFSLKTQDRIVEEDGTTWVVNEVNEVAEALVRCPVTKKR